MSFLEYLSDQGIITEGQASTALRKAGGAEEGSLDEALIASGVDERTLLGQKSAYYNIPSRKVDIETFPLEVLKYVPEDTARRFGFVPLGIEDEVLLVGLIDPENVRATDVIQFIATKLNKPYKIFLISPSDYKVVLEKYKGMTGEVEEALSELDREIAETGIAAPAGVKIERPEEITPEEERKIVEEAPIIKMVATIINTAVEGNASDIHIENTGEKVRVRFRVDGVLHTSLTLPLKVFAGIVARIKILAKLRLDEKRKPQDGGFSARVKGRKVDFRVSTFPTYYGEKVEMRILDPERGVRKLEELGLSERNLALVRRILKRPYGLILITGPTGSGKTTTLYSMLNELDRESNNVVSLEDPVEYRISNVSQSEVMPEIGYTFASGLRSVFRQDPDVILVGEIRDKETAQLAIQAALTGHLVFSTLHTNNAIGVVPRLMDMGIDPYLIAATLTLAVAQRLVHQTCESSRKEVPTTEIVRKEFEKTLADLPDKFKREIVLGDKMYETVPSAECPLGTSGRTAVFEMYEVDSEVQEVILKKPSESAIYEVVRKKGMITMQEDGLIKAVRGEIPIKDARGLAV